MKVLCIYPGLNKKVNDVAQLISYLSKKGVDLVIVTARSSGREKSAQPSAHYEVMDGAKIYRVYESFFQMVWFPEMFFQEVLELAKRFNPEVIFCSQEYNMRIAVKLRKRLGVPIVLLVEIASDIASGGSRGVASSFLWQAFGIPYGRAYWKWLSKWSESIITCDPRDQPILEQLSVSDTPVHYIPWCNQLPEDYSPAKERSASRATYVGSFSKFKNTDEFLLTIPILMNKTSTKEFVFVGGGRLGAIDALRNRYGAHIKHAIGMTRTEALELLSSCTYAYTPVVKGGWGFIGDSWATRTPLIMTHNNYCGQDMVDSIVVRPTEIDRGVNNILSNADIYRSLQENGFQHYLREHSANIVGDKLIGVLESAKG